MRPSGCQPVGNFPIRHRSAIGNALESLPHMTLKGGPLKIQCDLKLCPGTVKVFLQLLQRSTKWLTRFSPSRLNVERVGSILKLQSLQPIWVSHQQKPANRTWANPVGYLKILGGPLGHRWLRPSDSHDCSRESRLGCRRIMMDRLTNIFL